MPDAKQAASANPKVVASTSPGDTFSIFIIASLFKNMSGSFVATLYNRRNHFERFFGAKGISLMCRNDNPLTSGKLVLFAIYDNFS